MLIPRPAAAALSWRDLFLIGTSDWPLTYATSRVSAVLLFAAQLPAVIAAVDELQPVVAIQQTHEADASVPDAQPAAAPRNSRMIRDGVLDHQRERAPTVTSSSLVTSPRWRRSTFVRERAHRATRAWSQTSTRDELSACRLIARGQPLHVQGAGARRGVAVDGGEHVGLAGGEAMRAPAAGRRRSRRRRSPGARRDGGARAGAVARHPRRFFRGAGAGLERRRRRRLRHGLRDGLRSTRLRASCGLLRLSVAGATAGRVNGPPSASRAARRQRAVQPRVERAATQAQHARRALVRQALPFPGDEQDHPHGRAPRAARAPAAAASPAVRGRARLGGRPARWRGERVRSADLAASAAAARWRSTFAGGAEQPWRARRRRIASRRRQATRKTFRRLTSSALAASYAGASRRRSPAGAWRAYYRLHMRALDTPHLAPGGDAAIPPTSHPR